MHSTGALELPEVPERLLVIGGGIIGLEMATVYDALGSEVTVVEVADQLIPGTDKDLVRPLAKRIEQRYAAIRTGTKIEAVEAKDDGLHVGDEVFDRILVAVGRTPERQRRRRRPGRRRGHRPRLHRGRRPAAHERRRTSSPSATWSASRCSPTRPRTRAPSPPR